MSRKAFTLAETLITLAVIGVVAALTIPNLTRKYQAAVLQSQFKKSYSTLQQAVAQAVKENPDLYDEIRQTGNNLVGIDYFKDKLKPYLKVAVDCRSDSCPALNFSSYRNYQNTMSGWGNWGWTGYFVLEDGSAIFFECSGGCAAIPIFVDINGTKKPPNRMGHDLFAFQIDSKNKLVPATLFGSACSASDVFAGFDCTKQALIDPDYFKKLPR